MRSIVLALLLAIGIVSTGGVAWSQQIETDTVRPRGPLPMRDDEPINALFLLPTPVDASILGKNAQRLDLNVNAPNNFLILPSIGYYTDFEDHRWAASYARGLGAGQQVTVNITYVERGGGIFDPIVSGWHDFFHIYNVPRHSVPNYQSVLRIPDAQSGKYVIDSTQSVSGFGDTTLEYSRALTQGEAGIDASGKANPRRVALSMRALLKLPTGSVDELLGSGATDFGVGLVGSARPFRRVAFHANLSMVWDGRAANTALVNRRTSLQSMGAVEWMMDGRTSFLIQIDDAPAPNKSGTEYTDRNRRMFSFGFLRQIAPRQSAFIGLGENDFGRAALMAPDVTFSAGTRWTL